MQWKYLSRPANKDSNEINCLKKYLLQNQVKKLITHTFSYFSTQSPPLSQHLFSLGACFCILMTSAWPLRLLENLCVRTSLVSCFPLPLSSIFSIHGSGENFLFSSFSFDFFQVCPLFFMPPRNWLCHLLSHAICSFFSNLTIKP